MFKRSVIAMACIVALSACGGGGGGSPDVKSADTPSKPAAPVVAEKETEVKEDAPQAGSQGQDVPSKQGSQDMAAVSAENTGNGGSATTDKPKNEDEDRKMICRKIPPNPQIKQGTTNPPILQIPPPRQTLHLRMAVAILEGLIWLMAF